MTARDRGPHVPGAGMLGMVVFLVSLTMLFAAGMIGYLIVRSQAELWVPPNAPGLPRGLWASTAVIVGTSAAAQASLVWIRRGRQDLLRRGLVLTSALAIVFLALQSWNWHVMVRAGILATTSLYGYTFYVLTGLHALHVVGGLVPLAFVTWRAWRGRYTWADYQGVRLCTLYWHFLGAVWIVLFSALVQAG